MQQVLGHSLVCEVLSHRMAEEMRVHILGDPCIVRNLLYKLLDAPRMRKSWKSTRPHCSFNVDHRLAKPFSTGPAATPYRRTARAVRQAGPPRTPRLPATASRLSPDREWVWIVPTQTMLSVVAEWNLLGSLPPASSGSASSGKNGSTSARSCPPDDRPSAPRRSRCPPFRLTMSV